MTGERAPLHPAGPQSSALVAAEEDGAVRLKVAPGGADPGAISPYVQSMLDTDNSAGRLGIVAIEAGEGRARVRQKVLPDMTNGLGVAQGGFIFALADHAFACAANTVLEGTATVEASISYLSPAGVDDDLEADARVTHSDERRVVVDITVRAGERVVALVRATGRPLRRGVESPTPAGVTETR